MRTCDSNSLLRIEDLTKCNRIRKVCNPKVPRLGEFNIRIYLFFWCKIRLGDDSFRVDNKVCIITEIFGTMPDMDIKSLISEGIKKW